MHVWEINKKLRNGARITVKLPDRDDYLEVSAARASLGDVLTVRVRLDGQLCWRNAAPSALRVEEVCVKS
jgi:hypothetical protein